MHPIEAGLARLGKLAGGGDAAGAVSANLYPFPTRSNTEVLTVLHLPIALRLAVASRTPDPLVRPAGA